MDYLPKDCEWIFGGDFNIIERIQDKSSYSGRATSNLERYTWNELLNTLQIKDIFIYQGGPRLFWKNGHMPHARRLARLDRFYILECNKLKIYHFTYLIHGYSVGYDHSSVMHG